MEKVYSPVEIEPRLYQRWEAAGWTQKLRTAVSSAGNRFAGPLASPHEPWHYAWIAP